MSDATKPGDLSGQARSGRLLLVCVVDAVALITLGYHLQATWVSLVGVGFAVAAAAIAIAAYLRFMRRVHAVHDGWFIREYERNERELQAREAKYAAEAVAQVRRDQCP